MAEEIKSVELADENLENVSGGFAMNSEFKVKHGMIIFRCPKPDCNHEYAWIDSYEPEPTDCPKCDKCGARMYVATTRPK